MNGQAPGPAGVAERLRRRLADVDDPRSLSARSRARRWTQLSASFPDLADMEVIDLGGTTSHWSSAPVKPRRLTLVNVGDHRGYDDDGVETISGDACALDESLLRRRFDLVYSNSVLEHVGGPWRRARFADAVHRLGTHYWVQTPYRYFPLEPHWLFPGFQFLPLAARIALTRRWKVGHRRTLDRQLATEVALEVELVSRTELAYLFPDAEMRQERIAGAIVKSLIAVKPSRAR